MGNTKIISHHHVFLKDINIDLIEQQVLDLQAKLTETIHRLPNGYLLRFKSQIDYINNKLNRVLLQLKSFEPDSRVKRGIINPLGTLIKFISGNLDHNDALRYEAAIN